MKVGGRATNTIAYKKTSSINPEINHAPSNIKPLVVKEHGFESNASMMAVVEQQKSEAAKREKEERIRNFQENIRLNASRISEQKSLNSINLKKQKEDVHQKQKDIKQQYTRVHSKKPEDTIRHINVKPQIIEDHCLEKQEVKEPVRKQPSMKAMRERSKSPLSPLGMDKSQIAIPKYIADDFESSSEDYIDSENQGEDVEEVMRNDANIRNTMSQKLQ